MRVNRAHWEALCNTDYNMADAEADAAAPVPAPPAAADKGAPPSGLAVAAALAREAGVADMPLPRGPINAPSKLVSAACAVL